jgi:DNA-binding NarL/FixJ family response regulator
MPITLVLVDDHPFLLDGLERLLSLDGNFEVLAKCGASADGLRAVETLNPDLLILDLKLRDDDGFTVLRELAGRTSPAVIVLTATDNEEDLLEAVRLGARGVVLKAMAPRILEECIRVVHAGGRWLNVEGQDLAARLARRENVERSIAELLTPREVEVLRLLASQYANDEIARRLGLSLGTVKIHVHHVYQKLNVSGRQDLMEYLAREGY